MRRRKTVESGWRGKVACYCSCCTLAPCTGVKIQQSLGRALLRRGKKSKSRLLQLECFEENAELGR